jgi:hypothetical protein
MTVELAGGAKAWAYPLPPEGFDPLEADQKSLARYGFPHRPRDHELLRVWKRALSRSIKIVAPGSEMPGSGRHHRGKVIRNSSNHWSGAEIISAPGQIFENVIGMWTVPNTYPDPDDDGWSYCSSWVGIGDASGNHLLQAGVEAEAVESGGRVEHNIFAWCELLPFPEAPINLPVSAGDNVLCAIGAGPSSEQDPAEIIGHIWFANLSQGLGTIIGVQGNYFAATNAEWIVERPGGSQTGYHPAGPLAFYGQVVFTECSAVITGTKTRADLSGGTAINMTSVNSNNIISSGQILNSSTVICTWDNYE